MTEALTLAADFPAVRRTDWLRLVEKVLKGADFERKLVSRTYDDVPIQPLYTREQAPPGDAAGFPGRFPYVRGARAAGSLGGWDVRVLQAHPDPLTANRQIREDLERGATSIQLRIDGALASGEAVPDGVCVADLADLEVVLAGVGPEATPIALDGSGFAINATLMVALWRRRGTDMAGVEGAFDIDPLGVAARGIGLDLEGALGRAAEVAVHAAQHLPRVTALLADGHLYHAGGSSSAQELACTMATAVDYLRLLERHGLPPERAARLIAFRLAVDADLFGSIAKLRAARLLWARITRACGAEARGMHLHALTGTRMFTRRDPWVNLLRGTLACSAAALGGADAITVLPFDHALGLPDAFSRRLARNTQLVLMEESALARVIDPVGGAWFVEELTRRLAAEAWSLFQTIDGGGGMGESLRRGAVQEWIAATWAERAANIARRKDPITGVSEFPDLAETPRTTDQPDLAPVIERARTRLAVAEDTVGRSFADMVELYLAGRTLRFHGHRTSYTPVVPHRLAEAFEELRDRGDALLARQGRRARVFLCNLGRAAEFSARAAFAANLFAAGGIETRGSDAIASPEEVAHTFKASGAAVAAICAGDAVHGELGAAAARALKAAHCRWVWVVGGPPEIEPELVAAGVDGFIRAGDDLLAVLARVYQIEGESP